VPSTKDVLNHHLKALKQGDVNAVLSDYAPGAVLFTKGADAIRPLFEAMITSLRSRSNIQNEASSWSTAIMLYFVDGRDCRKPDSELVER